MTLLIVNDEAMVADVMKSEVEWEKYGIDCVYTAYDVSSAKNIINSQHVQILLCDVEMPRENGLQLIRWIRENKKAIECILLTCYAKFEYAKEAVNLECKDYILMPAKYEDIGSSVKKVVERLKNKRNEESGQEKKDFYEIEERDHNKSKQQQLITEIESYIIENIGNNDLTVDSIANRFHFHSVYLNRFFKSKKNISISRYILNKRMEMAELLLKEGKYDLNEVANQVGYANYTNFYMMFKKIYGISPKQFLENYLEE